MASIYKKKYPRPMPEGAEIITRHGKPYARWQYGSQVRMAKVLDDGRILYVSECWYISYRDLDGRTRRPSTGCRNKEAARKILADLLADLEKVKAGIMTREQLEALYESQTPLDEHIRDYLGSLAMKTIRGRKVSPFHVRLTRDRLRRIVCDCGMRRLQDIKRRAVQQWMTDKSQQPRDSEDPDSAPLAARTINIHRAAMVAFCNWSVDQGRMSSFPLKGLTKLEEAEPARKRRALSEDEIARLLKAARRRPLREAWTIHRGKYEGQLRAEISPERRRQALRLGQERALIYKFMILTGLRKSEVQSLTVSSVFLDADHPYLYIEGRHAKSGKSARLPLRQDLAKELRKHLVRKTKDYLEAQARRAGRSRSMESRNAKGGGEGKVLPQETPLFKTPSDFIRIFNRDLEAAGIPKCDARGRTVDIHALRHTFATLLAKNGTSPAIAQKLMRHSDIRLTMNIYTHMDLADTAKAVAGLLGI